MLLYTLYKWYSYAGLYYGIYKKARYLIAGIYNGIVVKW